MQARGIAKQELAWGSTAEWFTHTAGTTRRDGHRTVRQAPLLVGERTATHAALAAGRVSPEQAAVIVAAVEELPLDGSVREQGEAFLLDQSATRLTATELAKAARHLAEVADPDKAERDAEKDLDRADRAAHHHRFLSITDDGAGGVRLKGRGTLEDAATIKAALLPLTKPAPATDPPWTRDMRAGRPIRGTTGPGCGTPWSPRCEHVLATDLAPDCHGARPRLAVTTSLDVLRGQIDWTTLGAAVSTTDDGLDLAPSVVRRLACDADLIPIALGTHGEVLDVGRTQRLVTPALWRALVCRDAHCAFPGCTRPPVMCHAHHILHWADGGHTTLDQPRPAVRAAPPHHPPHPLGSPPQPRRRPTRVPPTTQTRPPTTRLDPQQTPTRVTLVPAGDQAPGRLPRPRTRIQLHQGQRLEHDRQR